MYSKAGKDRSSEYQRALVVKKIKARPDSDEWRVWSLLTLNGQKKQRAEFEQLFQSDGPGAGQNLTHVCVCHAWFCSGHV